MRPPLLHRLLSSITHQPLPPNPALPPLLVDIRKIQIGNHSRPQDAPHEFNNKTNTTNATIGVTDNKTPLKQTNTSEKEKEVVGDRGGGPYRYVIQWREAKGGKLKGFKIHQSSSTIDSMVRVQ